MASPLVSDDLEAFASFATHLNFTHAAAALHVSQPALHARIRKLEKRIGEELYVKSGRTLQLTSAGQRLSAFAQDAQERAASFANELAGPSSAPVTLAAGAGTFRYLIDGALARAHAAGYRVRPMTANASGVLAAVRAGTADIGVTALDLLPDDLIARPLGTFPQQVIFPAGHRLSGRQRVSLADLSGEDLVAPPPGRPHRTALEARALDLGVTWNVAIEAEGWDLITQFVAMGAGCAVVNGTVPVPAGLSSAVVTDLPPVRFYVLTRPSRDEDLRVGSVRDLVMM